MRLYPRSLAIRRGILPVLIMFGCVACGEAPPTRPDILVVVISNLRGDHVSSLGYARRTTPALDALADDGTLYESALTVTPWGPSAHASLLTGRYLSEHGVTFDHPVLEDALDTVAEHAAREGYATAAIVTDSAVSAATGFGQGFDSFVEIHPEEKGLPDDGAALAESELISWVRGRRDSPDTPWMAWVVLKNPALPWSPPEEFRDRFFDTPLPRPRLDQLSSLWVPFARQVNLGWVTLTPEDRDALVSLYDAEIAYADYRLGRILEGLKKEGAGGNLAVFVTSDAGEDLNDHGLIADSTSLFDTNVRVPLVASWPGHIARGQRVADQVITLDLPAAVLAIVRRDPKDSGSLDGLFKPRPVAISEARHDPGILEFARRYRPEEDTSYLARDLVGVRTPDRKFVMTSQGGAALFDLRADPGEHASILEADGAKAEELGAHIGYWVSALRPPPPGAGPPPFGPVVQARPEEGAAPE